MTHLEHSSAPLETASLRAASLAWDTLLPDKLKAALLVLESVLRLPAVLQAVMADVEALKDIVADLRKRQEA